MQRGFSAAERALLPRIGETPADRLVLANDFSCREQVEQCTGRRTMHVAEAGWVRQSMIPKSGYRFSEKIMLRQ